MTAPYRDVPSERVDPYEDRGGAWGHLADMLRQVLEHDPRVNTLADGDPDSHKFAVVVYQWIDTCKARGLLHPDHEPLDLVARWARTHRYVSLGHRMPDGTSVSLETWWASTRPKGPYL